MEAIKHVCMHLLTQWLMHAWLKLALRKKLM